MVITCPIFGCRTGSQNVECENTRKPQNGIFRHSFPIAFPNRKRSDDHAKRFELAGGLMAAGDRYGAADHLLEIIRADREWNDGAAKAQLLKVFEVVGVMDPWVSAQRRRLSAVLFT